MTSTVTNETPQRSGAIAVGPVLVFLSVMAIASFGITQWEAYRLNYQSELGTCWFTAGSYCVYRPWGFMTWGYQYWRDAPGIFGAGFDAAMIASAIATTALLVYALLLSRRQRATGVHGTARWANTAEYEAAHLVGPTGVILGMAPDGRYLRDDGPEHIACIAPTRSGKGVGMVIPTLLTWPGSVLVHDMRAENWEKTAACRARFSHVIYFAPTDPKSSAHWNPLFEVRADEHQVGDVQNICDQLVDPLGKGKESHWDRTADQFLLAVILHVLHAEADKSFYGVKKFLSDPDRTFEETLLKMKFTRHTSAMAHERIASGAQAMFNKSEEERSGILSTALGFLGLYADPIVARNTQDSDFRIADLREGEHPMSLYIVVPDSDRLRLVPLTRLMITLFTQRLVERAAPNVHRHRLLMLIDEFPRLGKMPFFADALSTIAGHDIKIMLVMQSVGQAEAGDYPAGKSPLDMCHTRAVMTPQDLHTAEWISKHLGPTTTRRPQRTYTGGRLSLWLGHVMVAEQETGRPLMDPSEVERMSADQVIVFVKGQAPFRATRLKYFAVPALNALALLPPPPLGEQRPYPYRPRPRPEIWDKVLESSPPPPTSKSAESSGKGRRRPRHLAVDRADDVPEQVRLGLGEHAAAVEEAGGEGQIQRLRQRALDDSQHHGRRHRRGVS